MKLRILSLVFAFFVIGTTSMLAQMDAKSHMTKSETKVISLEQTSGEFTIQSLTLSPGEYTFEISNNDVGHEVGFVLAPKGKTDAANHIKEAYVTSAVPTGGKQKSNVVTLAKGEYVYFCPLNPTPQYTLTVK
jgi:plastocyanin